MRKKELITILKKGNLSVQGTIESRSSSYEIPVNHVRRLHKLCLLVLEHFFCILNIRHVVPFHNRPAPSANALDGLLPARGHYHNTRDVFLQSGLLHLWLPPLVLLWWLFPSLSFSSACRLFVPAHMPPAIETVPPCRTAPLPPPDSIYGRR
jgi:hypothetical protein